MPIVLVVDDSPVDRMLVSRLLGQEPELDWVIESAEDAESALAFMEDVTPHAVVTDLIMPGMNGLEFVGAVRGRYPEVPVILITGQGSETLAVEALERGAASYVPKSQLADKLVDTVKQVLAVARAEGGSQRLAECLVEAQFALQLDNDTALIPALVDQLQQLLAHVKFGDATERVHLGVALQEALLNALYHGNLGLSPDQAQQARSELTQGRISPLVRERRAQPLYQDRRIHVEIRVSPAEVRFVVRDEGAGFTRPGAGDSGLMERRGLVLMRHFMDRVTFNDTGNEVTLVKRRD